MAIQGFAEYARRYSSTDLTDNAIYWIGECNYSKKLYKEAIDAFTQLLNAYKTSDKAAAALLKKGLAYLELGEKQQAVINLQYVIYEHPGSKEADLARDRLLLLRSSSGNVLLTGGARVLRCDTASGKVRLEGLLGPVGIATTSGTVTARFDALAPTDEIKVSTTSGAVAITLPPGSTPGGELSSAKADIRSVYPGTADPEGGKLQLSGSGPKLAVTTTSGKIELL
jgi:tol-pal system protein YbgF